jgi:hypothetical protein
LLCVLFFKYHGKIPWVTKKKKTMGEYHGLQKKKKTWVNTMGYKKKTWVNTMGELYGLKNKTRHMAFLHLLLFFFPPNTMGVYSQR